MKRVILSLCAIIAVALATTVELDVAKDLLSNPSEGGSATYHNADKYTIECCSASNPSYLFTAYNIQSLSGKYITSATLNVNALSNTPPQRVSSADNSKNPNVQFYNATSFSETPTTDLNMFPNFDQSIATVYLSNGTTTQIDVTSFVQSAVAANNDFFNVGWNPTGGYGASVTVAARQAYPRTSYLTVVYGDMSSTSAPSSTCPPCPCGSEVNLSGDNNASPARRVKDACPVCKACPSTTSTPSSTSAPSSAPQSGATCPPCPCGSDMNLSGDNNASPARRVKDACPVCKACPSTAAPISSAPSVNLTPKPTNGQTSSTNAPQNESGEDNSQEKSGAATIIAGAAAVAAAAAAML